MEKDLLKNICLEALCNNTSKNCSSQEKFEEKLSEMGTEEFFESHIKN
ncbi:MULTISPECIES: hypothetical protein [unclassified Sedimentibacter]|nr:hypothetical protein [Sedimentibacter sp. MB35-C1]WMJ77129.1 hypothetical protein RBQ61_16380 [Sedimentibacter sp. MB35-C1]